MQHSINVDLGAMRIRIACTYSVLEQCWTALVASIVDNDGCEDWDINMFNKLVLSKFVCYNKHVTAEQLGQQLCASIAQEGLYAELA